MSRVICAGRKHGATHFAIASNLLGDDKPLAWSNLGAWKHTSDYVIACQQLAALVGEAAQLQASSRVLDLGCGHGASLHFWHTRYLVQQITGFELQAACVARIQQAIAQQLLPAQSRIFQADFGKLPLPDNSLYQAFDRVLCVDAAYHVLPHQLVALAHAALVPSGILAFTTLIKSEQWPTAPVYLKRLTTQVLRLAAIPALHLLSARQWQEQLQCARFTPLQISTLDQEVLQGFASYLATHRPVIAFHQRPAWLKIQLTAQLCQFLYRHGLVHYALIKARRQ